MSKYYNINGLKVRVSDHEPNDKLNGSNDIELYVKSADNQLLSIESQIERICERMNLNERDFEKVINDWKDGSYDMNIFEGKKEEIEDGVNNGRASELMNNHRMSNDEILSAFSLSRFAKHAEIKELSEETGISQSYIKKYFNIR